MSAGPLLDVARARTQGRVAGIYSVCSANRFVLEAAMHEADASRTKRLAEQTE